MRKKIKMTPENVEEFEILVMLWSKLTKDDEMRVTIQHEGVTVRCQGDLLHKEVEE